MVGHHFHELLITIYCIYSVYSAFSPGLSSSSGRRWCWLSDPCRGGEYDACSCCVRSPGERASSSCWASASSTTLHETAHVGGTQDGYFEQTLSAVGVLKTKAMASLIMSPNYTRQSGTTASAGAFFGGGVSDANAPVQLGNAALEQQTCSHSTIFWQFCHLFYGS